MRDLQHYLDTLSDTETVGAKLLGEAVHVARHGEQGEPDDLRPIIRDLPESTDADDAIQRLLVERARAELAPDGHPGTAALARELGVAENTIRKWLRGDRTLSGPARKMVEQIALKK